MKCPVCDQPLPDDSEFCQYCGAKLSHEEKQPVSASGAESAPAPKKNRTWLLPCISGLAVFLAVCLIASFCYIRGQQTRINELTASLTELEAANTELRDTNKTLDKENSELMAKNKTLTTKNDELATRSKKLSDDLEFYEDSIGFVTDENRYYHKFNRLDFSIDRIRAGNTYEAHNKDYCERLGYFPCPKCW